MSDTSDKEDNVEYRAGVDKRVGGHKGKLFKEVYQDRSHLLWVLGRNFDGPKWDNSQMRQYKDYCERKQDKKKENRIFQRISIQMSQFTKSKICTLRCFKFMNIFW